MAGNAADSRDSGVLQRRATSVERRGAQFGAYVGVGQHVEADARQPLACDLRARLQRQWQFASGQVRGAQHDARQLERLQLLVQPYAARLLSLPLTHCAAS